MYKTIRRAISTIEVSLDLLKEFHILNRWRQKIAKNNDQDCVKMVKMNTKWNILIILKWRAIVHTVQLTLNVHSPRNSKRGSEENALKVWLHHRSRSHMGAWNRCPGSNTWVACHGCTVHCGAGAGRPAVQIQGGTLILDPSLSEEIV